MEVTTLKYHVLKITIDLLFRILTQRFRLCRTIYHLPPEFLSIHDEEPLPGLFPQTPVSDYSWPHRTQASPPRVGLPALLSGPFLWWPLYYSYSPYGTHSSASHTPICVLYCNFAIEKHQIAVRSLKYCLNMMLCI